MFYGTDYYPELWPREQWPRDLDLMVAAGLNVLRVGDLCWSTMEQEPSRYTFAWLDDALGLIQERGIRVVMCTPTASPPPWLVEED
ncbi:MAG: beta-galactosidase, partial [Chloroflexota bacterium]|nr:beta-galactosidase [Chloroflexota bacterium]